jgi:uncharacterized protein (TIGR02271 family)
MDDQTTWSITGGMDVMGSDGEKVGDVAAVQGDYIVVSKGFFFPTDYYIPSSAVASVSDTVTLNVTKEEALNQGWDVAPDEAMMDADDAYDDRPITDAGLRIDNPLEEDGTLRVPLADEELHASTREIERGRARVEKAITEEEQELDVPVTEEQVTVNRREVDRDVEPGETVFSEETIEIPLKGEEVVIDKHARVREVIEIGKEQVERVEHVTETVRHEEARVLDEAGNVVEPVDATLQDEDTRPDGI